MEQAVQNLNDLRAHVQGVADTVKFFKDVVSGQLKEQPHLLATDQTGELLANITLAYRHLEDAKMRLGKAIQAIEGASVYDTPANK